MIVRVSIISSEDHVVVIPVYLLSEESPCSIQVKSVCSFNPSGSIATSFTLPLIILSVPQWSIIITLASRYKLEISEFIAG